MGIPKTNVTDQKNTLKRMFVIFSLAALTIGICGSCASKYSRKLYLVSEDERTAVKPSEMFYVEGLVISSPFAEQYTRKGKGHLAAMAYSVKDTYLLIGDLSGVLQYHPRTDYRMILPLPENIAPGAVELDNSAFVRDFSTADISLSKRTFLFAGGAFSIDSIKSSDLYTTINAVFRSIEGDSLKYEGQMKFLPRKQFSFRGVIYDRIK